MCSSDLMARTLKAKLESNIVREFEETHSLRLTPPLLRALLVSLFSLLLLRLEAGYEEWRAENSAIVELQKKRSAFPNIFSVIVHSGKEEPSFTA